LVLLVLLLLAANKAATAATPWQALLLQQAAAVAAVVAITTLPKSAAKTAARAVAVKPLLTNLMSVLVLAALAFKAKVSTAVGAVGGGKPPHRLAAVAVEQVAKANQQVLTPKAVKVGSAQKDSQIGQPQPHQVTAAISQAVAVAVLTPQLVLAVLAAAATAVFLLVLRQLQTLAVAAVAAQRAAQALF
jgi:hypothetical protein